MKFPSVRILQWHGKIKALRFSRPVEYLRKSSFSFFNRFKPISIAGQVELISQKSHHFLEDIKSIGFTRTMDDLERRKLSIFNQLNFFQLVTGIVVPLTSFLGNKQFPFSGFFIAILPALVSFLVLYLNLYHKYQAGMFAYFILYPVVTSIVYMNGMNLGVELFFILYGILSVFFLQEISQMLFSVSLSMISYFILAVICKNYTFQLQTANFFFYLFNQVTAILFIFYGLFLIKKENTLYQFGILTTNKVLQEKNLEIEKQKQEIEEKAKELSELNSLKNKLFSVIAHDLKSPIHALRNLFAQMQQQDIPAKEIKTMIPDAVQDLTYLTGLMENLLQWAKSQMQSATIKPQKMAISDTISDVINILHLQASFKKIVVHNNSQGSFFVHADMDMIHLVLRNLISNAIKFTPENGKITVGIDADPAAIRVSVQDTGMGISKEEMDQINENNYYSTSGTQSEPGTGLGLMLCKEFLLKNGSYLQISSESGGGSTFSFNLPRAES